MRTLILMRHAKSDWSHAELSDHDRPLNARGLNAAPKMAIKLASEGLEPDVILASSAVRVQQTVSLMQENWSSKAELLTEPSLYLASPETIAKSIEGLHDSWSTALVVGHNPGMLGLVSYLAQADMEMPTAAMAVFTSQADSWLNCISGSHWQLQAFWKPKALPGD